MLGLVNCAPAPQLPDTLGEVTRQTGYPRLAPLSDVQGRVTGPRRISADSQTAFDERVAALRIRAAQMARPVIDRRTRARMQAAVTRAALR